MDIESADRDEWRIAEGTSRNTPITLRYRPSLKAFLGDKRYPKSFTITWEYEVQNSSGMPSDEQSDELKVFEDLLIQALDPDRIAVLSFILTSAGQRKWYFYIKDVQEVGKRINDALSDKPGLPISLTVDNDPDWSELKKVLDNCIESKEP